MGLARALRFLTLIGAFFATNAPAQNILTTFAGGDWVYPKDPLPATTAPLGTISSLSFAPNGDLLAADADNALILRITPGGTASVVAGNGISAYSGDGGPATKASLVRPAAVLADTKGSIYIADINTSVPARGLIRKVLPDGTITTFSPWALASPSNYPQAMAVDPSGLVHIASSGRVWRFNADGSFTPVAGTDTGCAIAAPLPSSVPCVVPTDNSPALSTTFAFISGITFDASGNLFIVDQMQSRTYKVNASGRISSFASNVSGGQPTADRSGNIYIPNNINSASLKMVSSTGTATTIAGNGTRTYSGDGGPAVSSGMERPAAVAVNSSGTIFVADASRIRSLTAGGTIRLFAGNGQFRYSGDGGPARSATFRLPGPLATDSNGTLYIADGARIRRVNSSGIITNLTGNGVVGFTGDNGPAGNAQIGQVTSMATDTAGNLYFADWDTQANFACSCLELAAHVRKISTAGIITSIRLDPTVAISVMTGMTVDRSGNLYLSDATANKVWKITPAGVATTFAGTGNPPVNFGFNGDNIQANQALLSFPRGLASDASGNVYIADGNNSRIRRVGTNGVITTVVSNIGQAQFLTIDASNTLYSMDSNTVLRISNGVASVYAGNGGSTADSGTATAMYILGNGLAVDRSGNIFISDYNRREIREVLATKPTVTATPASLSFRAIADAAAPPTQSIAISGLQGLTFNLVAATNDGRPWLSVPPTAVAPASVAVSIDPRGLPAGTYTGSISILGPAPLTPTSVTVSLTITAAAAPQLSVQQKGLSFSLTPGTTSAQQLLVLSNTGGGSVVGNPSVATDSGGSWLSLLPFPLNIPSGTTATFPVTVNATALQPGTYSGRVILNTVAPSGQVIIPVTLTILANGAQLSLSQTGLTFTAVAGASAPPAQAFSVLNSGSVNTNWTATTRTLTGPSNWLSATPSNGTTTAPLGASPVQVSVNASGMSAGSYQGQITVTPSGSSVSQAVTVFLNILPAGSALPPVVRPTGLIFTAPLGALPSSQQITVTNLGTTALNYTSGRVPEPPGAWFTVLPSQGAIAPGQTASITVQPNVAPSVPGITRGSLTLLFDDGSLDTLGVLFIARPDPPSSSLDVTPRTRTAGTCIPAQLTGVVTSFASGQAATVGQPFTLSARVIDNCGDPITQGPVSANFDTGDAPLPLNYIGDGYWEASWTPPLSARGTTSITITASIASAPSAEVARASISVNAPTGAAIPLVSRGGIVSAANPVAGTAIGLGGLITIYGSGFATQLTAASTLPMPTTLAGVQVTLGNRLLPLLFVSPGQINAIVPYDMPTNVPLQLSVSQGTITSAPEPIVVTTAQPAVFLLPQLGANQSAIVGPSGIVTPDQPVNRGETIVIYSAGLGPVNPSISAGAAAPLTELLYTANPVTVKIGGQSAVVQFAGLAPGFVGGYQVNAVVPAGIAAGNNVPVVIEVAGQTSAPVTISVK